MTSNNSIPYCPLLSVGSGGIDMICTQEKWAWYLANVRKCSIDKMGYNALLDASSKKKPVNQ